MPSDDTLTNPITGQRLRFVRTAAETGGELLEMESAYRPGGWPPVLHVHPIQWERFVVLEGTLRVILDGEERDVRAGETIVVEPGVVHEMWNPGAEWARVTWQVRPALRTESLFRTAFGLAQDGLVNARGIPNLLQLAVLLRAHDAEFRLAKPPHAVQKVLFGVLAPIGRLLGYRARYDRYAPTLPRAPD
jgi:quercetin dioxygenase-like cupin family protein